MAVLATAGSTVPWLRRVSVLGVRSGDGPQGHADQQVGEAAAGVVDAAQATDYRLVVSNGSRRASLSLADLRALPQHTERLPIACVEGWSATGDWTGVRIRDLLDLVGAPRGRGVVVTSLQQHGPFRSTTLQANFADHDRTLLALALDGEALDLDHGYPARLIAPDRPGRPADQVGRLDRRGGGWPMTPLRILLIAIGTALAAYGGFLLLDRQDLDRLAPAGAWLAAGVLLHDAVLAPLTIAVGLAAARWLPPGVRAPGTVALVVLGPLTLLAVPVLGRYGARPDNPTLLDRPYLLGWLVCAGVVVAGAALGAVVVRSRHRKESHGAGARGR